MVLSHGAGFTTQATSQGPQELENDAATTKLLYSDGWLRGVAPKWAGETMS